MNEWLEAFLSALYVNGEIWDAIDFANDFVGDDVTYPLYNSSGHYVGDTSGPMPLYHRGDEKQFINVY